MNKRLRFMADLIEPLRVVPGSTVRLSHGHDPGHTGQVARPKAADLLAEGVELLARYQDRLAAQDTYGVLLVLQGLDASGKDGVVKHVMTGVNPQAVAVRSFKQPSAEELNHDFLWRQQAALPSRGSSATWSTTALASSRSCSTCPSGNRPSGSESASTIRRRTGSSHPATSGNATNGTTTSRPSTPC